MTIGERIKQARLEAGLTQLELADKIGKKPAAVNKYETGLVVNLKRSTISDIAKALNVSPVWLLGYTDADIDPEAVLRTQCENDEDQRTAENFIYLCNMGSKTAQLNAIKLMINALYNEETGGDNG